jgi:hypothetical protein
MPLFAITLMCEIVLDVASSVCDTDNRPNQPSANSASFLSERQFKKYRMTFIYILWLL